MNDYNQTMMHAAANSISVRGREQSHALAKDGRHATAEWVRTLCDEIDRLQSRHKPIEDLPTVPTVGSIAEVLGATQQEVNRVIREQNIRPVARADTTRVFSLEAVERIRLKMRTLIAIVIATMLVGCSGRPDLTEEQLDALQVLGEMRKPDPVRDAKFDYQRRQLEWTTTDPDWYKHGVDFVGAEENLQAEYERRKTVYGDEKAAAWIISEREKPVLQFLKEWSEPERNK